MRLARCTLPSLLQGMGWIAVRFPRSYRGHGPARYTLPSLLQGHPPSQSSGTLMSLQEGIAEPRALAWGYSIPAFPFSMNPRAGSLMPLRIHRGTQISICASWRAVCGAQPEYSPPRSRTVFPSRAARGSYPCRTAAPYLAPQRGEGISRGEAGMFRRDIRVSDAERGRVPCRS